MHCIEFGQTIIILVLIKVLSDQLDVIQMYIRLTGGRRFKSHIRQWNFLLKFVFLLDS